MCIRDSVYFGQTVAQHVERRALQQGRRATYRRQCTAVLACKRTLASPATGHWAPRLPTIFSVSFSAAQIWGGWWRRALVSPDGVAPSRMVSVSASVNLPLHRKVQKFSSGTGSPGWSRKRAVKQRYSAAQSLTATLCRCLSKHICILRQQLR